MGAGGPQSFLQMEPEGIAETLPASRCKNLEREIIVNGFNELLLDVLGLPVFKFY